jgi:gentisate 1,2-dioxygenase
MKFLCIDVDAQGHSFFKEIDLPQTGTKQRVSSKSQDVLYWTMSISQPGYATDFQRAPDLRILAIFSGQMNVTVSNGETRNFVRGDMLVMWDTTGQGHITRVVGTEPCHVLHMAVADKGTFTT